MMFVRMRHVFLLLLLLLRFPLAAQNEKVGLVLSGGGASGLAHIGVIKALEENNIPIDYITGVSMGGLVGCLYAMGYTPAEIEALVKSEEFRSWAYGTIEPKYAYYFKKKEDNASWISFKLSLDTSFVTNLPTNIISPIQMDFALMEKTAGAAAAAHYNFDSLMVPFRCLASDIETKKSVIFRSGDLGEAVRASMSYPFYLKPISVDGKLLFDGGLYNNFPSNVMYSDFFPDFIVGSNVASAFPKPDEDNLASQIRAMLTSKTDFNPGCENGVVVEPNANDVGLFEFDDPQRWIDSGYVATIRRMSEIKASLVRRTDPEELKRRREVFRAKSPALVFGNIEIEGQNMKKSQVNYVRKLLRHRYNSVPIDQLRPGYFRLAADDKIRQIFPVTHYNSTTGLYDLTLHIKKERDVITQFGGNFSNRPINMGFVGLQYNYLGSVAASFQANAYFGKLYSSVQMRTRIDFPFRFPFYIEPILTYNRWDFFKSSPAFFEDTKPPYLIQLDRYGELDIGFPVKNKGRIVAGYGLSFDRELYYQTETFTSADTVDRTDFSTLMGRIMYERNSLNRKQYASAGSYFALKARFVQGEELYEPGTTAPDIHPHRSVHNWAQFKLVYDNYYKGRGRLRLGVYFEAVYASQTFFSNYTATMLSAPAFQPTPESKTFFIPEFRAYQYAAFGLKQVISPWKKIDIRAEAYIFAPYQQIRQKPDYTAEFGPLLSYRAYLALVGVVYHSPLGPISVSLNYYSPREKQPFSLLFHMGYILFNKRSND